MTIHEQAEQVYKDLMNAAEPPDQDKDIATIEAALRDVERATWEEAAVENCARCKDGIKRIPWGPPGYYAHDYGGVSEPGQRNVEPCQSYKLWAKVNALAAKARE